MCRTSYYVDGFNLYHAIKPLERPELKWLNLHALATSFLRAHDRLAEVTYFTAMLMWSAEKCQRHKAYIDALSACGVSVVNSRFIKSNRFCRQYERYCGFHEEKQTDVAIAVKVLRDAQRGSIERAILVTADSDQIPLLREVRESFPALPLEIAAPPGRMSDDQSGLPSPALCGAWPFWATRAARSTFADGVSTGAHSDSLGLPTLVERPQSDARWHARCRATRRV